MTSIDELRRVLGDDHPLLVEMRSQRAHRDHRGQLHEAVWTDPRFVRAVQLVAQHHPDAPQADALAIGRELLKAAWRVRCGVIDRGTTPAELVATAQGAFQAVLDHGLTRAGSTRTNELRTRVAMWCGIAAGLGGDDTVAADRLELAAQLARSGGVPQLAGRANEELAELHRARGDTGAASNAAGRARRAFEKAGQPHRVMLLDLAMDRDRADAPTGMFLDEDPAATASTVLGSYGGVVLRDALTTQHPAPAAATTDASGDPTGPGLRHLPSTVVATDPEQLEADLRRRAAHQPLIEAATELHAEGTALPDVLLAAHRIDAATTLRWAHQLASGPLQQAVVLATLAPVTPPEQLVELTFGGRHPDPVALATDTAPDASWLLRLLTAAGRLDPGALSGALTRFGTERCVEQWDANRLIQPGLLRRLAALEDRRAYHLAVTAGRPGLDEVTGWVKALRRFGADRTARDLKAAGTDPQVIARVAHTSELPVTDALELVTRGAGQGRTAAADLLLAAGADPAELAAGLAGGRRWPTAWRWLTRHLDTSTALATAQQAGATPLTLLDVLGPKRRSAVETLRRGGVDDTDIDALLAASGLDARSRARLLGPSRR